jgi:hypothetical protein
MILDEGEMVVINKGKDLRENLVPLKRGLLDLYSTKYRGLGYLSLINITLRVRPGEASHTNQDRPRPLSVDPTSARDDRR